MAALRFISPRRFISAKLMAWVLLPLAIAGSIAPATAAPARARKPRYTPAQPGQPPVRTEAGGRRGCARNAQSVSVQLLTPPEKTPQTINDRPEFFWYLSNPNKAEIPIEFSLVKPGILKPLYQTTLKAKQSGVMSVRLPNDVPGLKTGETYRWMVSLNCDAQRSADVLENRASIKRIAPPTVMPAITAQTPAIDQINAYGQSALWYDALSVAAQNRNQPEVKAAWDELLEDGQLPKIE